MTDTEQWAFFTTSVATDLANSCRNPIRPCALTTMQSMSLLWAYLTTSSGNLPHEERTVVDAFREVRVQEVFHLFQQGLGGRDSVGLALAGEVVGFIDRFGREHVHDRNGSARQGRHHLHVFDSRMGASSKSTA